MGWNIPRAGCFGWILLWLGALILLERNWIGVWGWFTSGAGVYFIFASVRSHSRFLFVPGVTFLTVGVAFVLKQQNYLQFPEWRTVPIILLGLGMGLALRPVLKNGPLWTWIPAGIFMTMSGAGLASNTWYGWQRWLRNSIAWWPLLLAILVGILLAVYLRRRQEWPPPGSDTESAADSSEIEVNNQQ
ncbi:MAG: hypothetical protein FJY67_10905 [Calditrichaeota bacterium]|nr:hypothetical protein [Calditrichota bacterium]